MKKLFAALLVMAVLISFTACKTEEQVTIYVPVSETEYTAENGEPTSVIYFLYESGWAKKTSFTVSHSTDGKTAAENGTTYKYEDKHTTVDNSDMQWDKYTDEQGRVVSERVLYKQTSQLIQTVRTYDESGRILTQVTSTAFLSGSDTYLPQVTFTYEETEDGSKGTGTQSGYTEVYTYDKNHRLVSYTTLILGTEQSRTEYTYDEHGNVTEMAVYTAGEFSYKTVTAYKAEQVNKSTADCLPQFNRET